MISEMFVRTGDDFGIPPMRLVPGRYLEQLGKFPGGWDNPEALQGAEPRGFACPGERNEQDMVVSAVTVPLRPNHPTGAELLKPEDRASEFGITFVSHRWHAADQVDTDDHSQARALIGFLDSDANPHRVIRTIIAGIWVAFFERVPATIVRTGQVAGAVLLD